MPNPFDYIKSINNKNRMDDLSGFNTYLTNIHFSAHPNFVHIANVMNTIGVHKLPKQAIYDFYFSVIPKNNKFWKFPSKLKEMELIKYIKAHFQVTEEQARDYLSLIDKNELKAIVANAKTMEKPYAKTQ